jgi:hypothetical protein
MLLESAEGYIKRHGEEEIRREVTEYRNELASRLIDETVGSQMIIDEAQQLPGCRGSQVPNLSKILKTDRKHSVYPIADYLEDQETQQ